MTEKADKKTKVKKEKKEVSLKLPVFTKAGKKSGDEIDLHPEIFGARVNARLLDIVMISYGANQRQGTHDTKERKEISGGGKKPWKQKGTGRARAGSIRSPIWRGGGTVFGPTPRDYSTNIPQQLRKKALVSALSKKFKDENILILEDVSVDQPKTRELYQIIEALKLENTRALCVVPSMDENLKRASSNLRELFSIRTANEVNAYNVLRRKKLIIDKNALPLIEKRIFEEAAAEQKPKRSKERVGV